MELLPIATRGSNLYARSRQTGKRIQWYEERDKMLHIVGIYVTIRANTAYIFTGAHNPRKEKSKALCSAGTLNGLRQYY